ncbi:MAG: PTS sugar transporter subunit IIA [Oscillibacter sp.]|jgi:PTS system galactitol-specific IIA component|nr:PTS sugar transporter subunit IIA [Oscillibacter sp.]
MKSVYEDLIVTGVDARDAEDVIRQVGQHLLKNGFVKDTYIDAVALREKEYPTGLQLKDLAVAMPHTAGVHVITPAVCIAKLAHPVTFRHMGDPDTLVEAELIFMMAIQDPNAQLETLQKVMGVFTNEAAVAQFKAAADKAALYKVAQTYIG